MNNYHQLLFKKHPTRALFLVVGALALIAVAVFVIDGGPFVTFIGRFKQPLAPQEFQESPYVQYTSNELLIKIKAPQYKNVKPDPKPHDTGIGSLNQLNKDLGVAKFHRISKPSSKSKNKDHPVFGWYKVTFPEEWEVITETQELEDLSFQELQNQSDLDKNRVLAQRLNARLARYKRDPNIETAEFNYIVHTQAAPPKKKTGAIIPNDSYYSSSGSWGQSYDDLWGLKKIQAEGAWNITTGSDQIVVGVIDTGIDYNHPDITANIWSNTDEIPNNGLDDDLNGHVDDVYGWDFIDSDNDPTDDHGHGTHVAGTIGAVGNNGIGVVGVNWIVKLMPVKFLNSSGAGTIDGAVNALIYATDNGARVLNNSWGGYGSSQALTDAVNYAHSRNAVVVAAAGNSNIDASYFIPAKEKNVITVSAFDVNDTKASFSNWGAKIDVAAPGVDILSLKAAVSPMCTDKRTVGTSYCHVSGTSMAAPHVSGLAALILVTSPHFTNEEVRQVLRVSADDVDAPDFDINSGYGRINAARALSVRSVLQVQITSPLNGTDISNYDTVEIRGTAAGERFASYKLEYGAGSLPTTWNLISSSNRPVVDGVLGTLNAALLDVGLYQIKLTAVDRQKSVFTDRIRIFKEKRVHILNRQGYQIGPDIYGDNVVWTERWGIYLYDLYIKTEREISFSGAFHSSPSIYQNKVVWPDDRNGFGNFDVYLYDLSINAERAITNIPGMQGNGVAVYGDKIVWRDNRNGDFSDFQSTDIYLYNLSTNTERRITTSLEYTWSPDIYRDKIVWQDYRNGNFDIYLYDLRTNTERQITTNSAHQGTPAIYQDRIVWEDNRNGNSDIYLYDLSTNTERQITTNSADQYQPDIYQEKIVWTDKRNGNEDIYLYDLSTNTEKQITASPRNDWVPSIDRGRIVWSRGDMLARDVSIYIYDPPAQPYTYTMSVIPSADTINFSWGPALLEQNDIAVSELSMTGGECEEKQILAPHYILGYFPVGSTSYTYPTDPSGVEFVPDLKGGKSYCVALRRQGQAGLEVTSMPKTFTVPLP